MENEKKENGNCTLLLLVYLFYPMLIKLLFLLNFIIILLNYLKKKNTITCKLRSSAACKDKLQQGLEGNLRAEWPGV